MEIYTGIDIVENIRIKKAVDSLGNRFLNRIFTAKEIEYCKKKKTYYECLAARFAAKEACIKAFYQAFSMKLFFSQIEILGKEGEPAEIFLHLNENQKKKIKKPFKSTLSISHEKTFSTAVVIIYTF